MKRWGICLAMVWTLVVSCLALPALGAGPAVEREAGACKVGGEPSVAERFTGREEDPLAEEAIVVACGGVAGEPVELVAAGDSETWCAWFERTRPDREVSIPIFCKATKDRWSGICPRLCPLVRSAGPTKGRRVLRTVVYGAAGPGRGEVRTLVGEGRATRAFPTLQARVTAPGLLRRLHQSEPFFIFGTILPRCYRAPKVRIVLLDPTGSRKDVVRGSNGSPWGPISDPCRLSR